MVCVGCGREGLGSMAGDWKVAERIVDTCIGAFLGLGVATILLHCL